MTFGLQLASAVPLLGQAVVTGTVREDSSGRALAGVEVVLERSAQKATTDSRGRYSLGTLPAGRQVLLFRSVGYRPVRQWVVVSGGDTVFANVMLSPGVVELAPVVVTATGPRGVGVEGFEERRKLGLGKFFDSTWIQQKEHLRLGQALGGGGRHVALAGTRRFGPQGEPCYSTIYLDGALFYRSPGPPGLERGGGADPELLPPPDLNQFMAGEFVAVELYRSAGEVPQEYGGASAACGVLLLWTRRGR